MTTEDSLKVPTFTFGAQNLPDKEYHQWLIEIKQRFQQSQIKTAIKVNTALLEFYWSLGSDIVKMQTEKAWGSGFINQLSLDLREAFPKATGFSLSNIKYIRQWYLFYYQELTKSHQVGGFLEMPKDFGLIPWRHHIEIISKCNSISEALFYIKQTISHNWSRVQLVHTIESNLFERQGKAISNFDTQLPIPQANLATELLKDPYNFDFLSLAKDYSERELEEALMQNITRFLLELGQGFAFVGRQMELRMPEGQSFFPDLIFYHIPMKCYVVVELKVTLFIPEYIGKLNFYVTAVDKLLRGESDNPTIGLLICKDKDELLVEWSLTDVNKPLGIASYQLKEIIDNTIAEFEKNKLKKSNSEAASPDVETSDLIP